MGAARSFAPVSYATAYQGLLLLSCVVHRFTFAAGYDYIAGSDVYPKLTFAWSKGNFDIKWLSAKF